jgi:hypothetical protein
MEAASATLEMRLVGDIGGAFRVARYQRGYRWGQLEVERLLDDIWNSKGESYCLQPIVVKREGENEWELVDGQQRLTTLYLIFLYLQRAGYKSVGPQYTISYDTRPQSQVYLGHLSAELAGANIDFFHLHAAYGRIQEWFERHGATPIKRQDAADDVFRYLCKSVRVIWYEAAPTLDATTLFTRLNVGRIPLTDAELFKALLVSRSRCHPGGSREHEIAAQWDSIERDLQHPDVWAFIADAGAVDTPTRITLLLDALVGGPAGRARPSFHTFDTLRAALETNGAEHVWNEVVQLHALVMGWYESRDHYHKVGYLVALGRRFGDLVALAVGKTKTEFITLLDNAIRDELDLSPSGVAALGYESNPSACTRVLLLMNVETVRRMKDSTERYSFRNHRRQGWSLEHVHAQQAESLGKVEQWKEWLRLHRDALLDLETVDAGERETLVHRIDDVGKNLDRHSFERLARDIAATFTLEDNTATHGLHSISNLALLSSGHNSALSNGVFEVKRRRILDLDRSGAYIPVCTRQVFLKYYTKANAQQIHFWSAQDREAYLQAILSSEGGVGAYLQPEVPQS